MTERWRNFFDGYGAFEDEWLKSSVLHWGFHEVLYGMIERFCPPPAKLLDVGSGPGWSDFYLSARGYTVTGIDNEPMLVSLASRQANRLGSRATFEQADAFDLSRFYGQFDLAFSCGVLEHFDRQVTVSLLREQSKCAEFVLIEIPTRYTKYTGEITDERIYTLHQLAQIVRDAGMEVVARFGYGELAVTSIHRALRQVLPRVLWRFLQNRGFCYAIAVLGRRKI